MTKIGLPDFDKLVDHEKQRIDKLEWMQSAAKLKLEKEVWHIYPIGMMGLAAESSSDDEMDKKWLTVPKGQLTFDAEGNDVDTSIYFSRKPHIPMQRDGTVIGQSGVTYGRGLDVGQQTQQFVSNLLSAISENARPLSDEMSSWLIVGSGKKRDLAKEHLALLNDTVPIDEQILTRKQQHFLFLSVYADRENTTKRTIEAARGSRHVLAPPGKIIWGQLPTDVQEVLVDLTFRGDNHSKSRDSIIPALVEGLESSNYSAFKNLMSDRTVWIDVFSVPRERFNARSSWVK
ncbi:pesticin C-terminus-like muramidase [Aeromonas sp. HMWF014]|uniref:pesticin C-terminus-like muramidase n=1 Tax=Aeromonas sp. HMWF014 TaxID=2056850 RepID=UPI0015E800DC|nr:pesticin C-terminus-like muramidase [Aeromonas sp. HMWF014]